MNPYFDTVMDFKKINIEKQKINTFCVNVIYYFDRICRHFKELNGKFY